MVMNFTQLLFQNSIFETSPQQLTCDTELAATQKAYHSCMRKQYDLGPPLYFSIISSLALNPHESCITRDSSELSHVK